MQGGSGCCMGQSTEFGRPTPVFSMPGEVSIVSDNVEQEYFWSCRQENSKASGQASRVRG